MGDGGQDPTPLRDSKLEKRITECVNVHIAHNVQRVTFQILV